MCPFGDEHVDSLVDFGSTRVKRWVMMSGSGIGVVGDTQSSSCQSITQFYRPYQLSESRFYLWRHKFQERSSPIQGVATLIPVRVVPGPSTNCGLGVRCLSGHVVEVDSADPSILVTLLHALVDASRC